MSLEAVMEIIVASVVVTTLTIAGIIIWSSVAAPTLPEGDAVLHESSVPVQSSQCEQVQKQNQHARAAA